MLYSHLLVLWLGTSVRHWLLAFNLASLECSAVQIATTLVVTQLRSSTAVCVYSIPASIYVCVYISPSLHYLCARQT